MDLKSFRDNEKKWKHFLSSIRSFKYLPTNNITIKTKSNINCLATDFANKLLQKKGGTVEITGSRDVLNRYKHLDVRNTPAKPDQKNQDLQRNLVKAETWPKAKTNESIFDVSKRELVRRKLSFDENATVISNSSDDDDSVSLLETYSDDVCEIDNPARMKNKLTVTQPVDVTVESRNDDSDGSLQVLDDHECNIPKKIAKRGEENLVDQSTKNDEFKGSVQSKLSNTTFDQPNGKEYLQQRFQERPSGYLRTESLTAIETEGQNVDPESETTELQKDTNRPTTTKTNKLRKQEAAFEQDNKICIEDTGEEAQIDTAHNEVKIETPNGAEEDDNSPIFQAENPNGTSLDRNYSFIQVPTEALGQLEDDVQINRVRDRDAFTRSTKSDIDKACSRWTVSNIAEYFIFDECVTEIKMPNTFSSFIDDIHALVTKDIMRRLETVNSINIAKRKRNNEPDVLMHLKSITATETGSRLILDALLIPLCSVLGLRIEVDKNINCNFLPNCRFDYCIMKGNQIIGCVEAKSVKSLNDSSVAQALLQLTILQTTLITSGKLRASISDYPIFAIVTDGHRFIYIQLKGTSVGFERDEDKVKVREVRQEGDFKTILHQISFLINGKEHEESEVILID